MCVGLPNVAPYVLNGYYIDAYGEAALIFNPDIFIGENKLK